MPLFDAYGRMVDPDLLTRETAGPSLTGIRQPFAGHPAQGLSPARLAMILRAAEDGDASQYLELAEEMEEKDLHYAAVLGTRKRAVAGLELTVEAATDEPRDVAAADLVRDFLNRDELRGELFDILDAIAKGYSVTEIIWDTSTSPWLPSRLVYRDPRFFEFDRLGQSLLLKTENGPEPLSAYKYIIHRCQAKSGLTIRGGLARAAAWFYLFKNFDLKAWVQFLEIFGLPLRLGKYGPGATENDKKTLLNAVRHIANDAAAIIPDSMLIEFVSAAAPGGKGTDNHLTFASYIDQQISKLVLGQTGTTDTGQYVGTSDAHREVRDDIEVADAVQLAATLNRDLVRPIVALNFGEMKLYPRLRIAREKREDLAALITNLGALVPMGLEVEMSVIRDKLGLPEPPKGAKILAAPAAAGMPGGWGSGPSLPGDEGGDGRQDGEAPGQVEAVPAPLALSGVQVTAMIEIVQQVAGGLLPRPSGLAILTAAFGLSIEEAEAIMGQAGQGFVIQAPQTAANSQADLAETNSIEPVMNKILALAGECQNYEEFQARTNELLAAGDLSLDGLGEDLAGQMFLATVNGALNAG